MNQEPHEFLFGECATSRNIQYIIYILSNDCNDVYRCPKGAKKDVVRTYSLTLGARTTSGAGAQPLSGSLFRPMHLFNSICN